MGCCKYKMIIVISKVNTKIKIHAKRKLNDNQKDTLKSKYKKGSLGKNLGIKDL